MPYKPLSDLPVRKIHIGSRIPIVRAELDGRFCSVTHIKKQPAEERDKKNKKKRRITKIGRNRENDWSSNGRCKGKLLTFQISSSVLYRRDDKPSF